jgi:hypothetical protein
MVDRTADGAVVSYVEDTEVRQLRVPGLTGSRVRSFVVSRDGTRLVAVVRREGRDVLVVSRIQHSTGGRVVGATSTQSIGSGGDANLPILAVAWTSPERVAVLVPLSQTLAEVATVSVDGSPALFDSSATISVRLSSLTGSPATDEPLYGFARGSLVEISSQRVMSLDPAITTLVYVG